MWFNEIMNVFQQIAISTAPVDRGRTTEVARNPLIVGEKVCPLYDNCGCFVLIF